MNAAVMSSLSRVLEVAVDMVWVPTGIGVALASLEKPIISKSKPKNTPLDKKIIQRQPTAGLEPGQSDFKDLGYDYDVVELVTEGLTQGFSREELIKHPQIVPLIEKQIQHYQSVFGIEKFDAVATVVDDVLNRHQQAKDKMKIIHPPTPQITLSYE